MQLTLDQKMACLKPGSIWRRRKLGQWQRVYLEAVQSKLLRDGSGFIAVSYTHLTLPTKLEV